MTIRFIAVSRLPTPWATFSMHGFEDEATGKDHIALTLGNIADGEPVLGRVHSECLTGDALFSMRCDCGYQLQEALKRIAREGRGVLLYLRQEGRGIGLLNKIRAYHLQDEGADTVEANEKLGFAADLRRYDLCVPMLAHLGVASLRLMTNNPRKVDALTRDGVKVVERIALTTGLNPHNEQYLATKAGKLGHMMSREDFVAAQDVDIERKP
ncbi:GTP cyclohydrolase II [Pistricoccus aurantiacus]|uniref:GTP cyclohydrolase-2 n=1 Tax=Pistricoccus aurantiacus TaxID=1883414 RepID=A0A5B8SUN8_9GAMM|nr:GTP cyclohydrolase II [Pistricoccus aurantiacus]QEA38450.1 GTP cyclohydrolase II [Pistricoccus aurantiacus]